MAPLSLSSFIFFCYKEDDNVGVVVLSYLSFATEKPTMMVLLSSHPFVSL